MVVCSPDEILSFLFLFLFLSFFHSFIHSIQGRGDLELDARGELEGVEEFVGV